jgi:hypothetical protein
MASSIKGGANKRGAILMGLCILFWSFVNRPPQRRKKSEHQREVEKLHAKRIVQPLHANNNKRSQIYGQMVEIATTKSVTKTDSTSISKHSYY